MKPALSRRRGRVFRLVAFAVPLMPLLIGEVVCRLHGYGGYPPVLRVLGTADGRTYIGSNQAGLSTFFFQNLTVPGSMDEQVFTMPKPAGTVRIFALGESAMRGYPQPPTLAATSFFQAMLADLWPERQVEVLNLGTTAVASFPVMHILDETLAFEPDLVMVYTGNNEFYGAHGVASVHAFGRSTTVMHLLRFARRSALVQWVTDVLTRRPAPEKAESDVRTLMERVIADQQLGPDDPRRTAAARNLENHLTRMVERCKARGVPIILCTLPANERDLAPIGEEVTPALPEDQQRRFEELLEAGRRAVREGPQAALDTLRSAAALYDRNATLHYGMGRCLTALGRHSEALAEYTRAKDLDTMPWRAPSALNEVVRRVAPRGGILCDLERVFEAQSPGGAIGWELTDDHVHPSLRGQALVATEWLRALAGQPGPLRVDLEAVARLPSWETYAERLGANEFDRYGVAHRMLSLLRAPFYARNNVEALARFEAICAEYEAEMTETELRVARQWQDPRTHVGGHRPITGIVGEALLPEGNHEKADRLLSIARRAVPKYSIWHLEFAWNALQCRRHLRNEPLPEDLALAREMIEAGETFIEVTGVCPPLMHRYLGLVYNLLDRHDPAVQHLGEAVRYVTTPEGLDVVYALVDSLVKTQQIERARNLLQIPVRDPVLQKECRRLLAELETGTP